MFSVRLTGRYGRQLSMSMFDGRGINEMAMTPIIAAEPQSSNYCKKPNSGLVVMAANHTKRCNWRGRVPHERASHHHEMEIVLSFSTAHVYTVTDGEAASVSSIASPRRDRSSPGLQLRRARTRANQSHG